MTRTGFSQFLRQGAAGLAAVGLIVLAAALLTCGEPASNDHPRTNAEHKREGRNDAVAEEVSRSETRPLSPEMREIAQLIAAGQHDLARLRLQRHLARDADNAHAQFLYGLTFHREMRYAQARRHFERAIELMPGYHPTYHFYGYCLYYLGELGAARRAFETHLAHAPEEGDSHFGLGLIALDENDLDAAEERFLLAVELEAKAGRDDGVAKSRARLGETFERRGRLEEAREQLEIATRMNPDLYEAFYILYRVLLRLGEEEAAERALAEHEAAKQRVRPEPPPASGP